MDEARRPLSSRDSRWARSIAAMLLKAGVRPNQVSIASTVMACCAGACLVLSGRDYSTAARVALYVAAAAFIQLRLLCNLFDGMLAVEGGLKSRSGEIYNDLPDRLSDPAILACAGYSIVGPVTHGIELGYLAAILALLTAYVRVLGASAGASHFFIGPMAKQHRMAVMTVACLASIPDVLSASSDVVMILALTVISLGCVVTIVRRVVLIVKRLESQ